MKLLTQYKKDFTTIGDTCTNCGCHIRVNGMRIWTVIKVYHKDVTNKEWEEGPFCSMKCAKAEGVKK